MHSTLSVLALEEKYNTNTIQIQIQNNTNTIKRSWPPCCALNSIHSSFGGKQFEEKGKLISENVFDRTKWVYLHRMHLKFSFTSNWQLSFFPSTSILIVDCHSQIKVPSKFLHFLESLKFMPLSLENCWISHCCCFHWQHTYI